MESNACEIGHSRRQNFTRKRSAIKALRRRIKDAYASQAPIQPFRRTSDIFSRNPSGPRIHEIYGHLAAMTLCVKIAAQSPEICDSAAILEHPAC